MELFLVQFQLFRAKTSAGFGGECRFGVSVGLAGIILFCVVVLDEITLVRHPDRISSAGGAQDLVPP